MARPRFTVTDEPLGAGGVGLLVGTGGVGVDPGGVAVDPGAGVVINAVPVVTIANT